MTTRETEPRARAPYVDDFEAEEEVDFGRYWGALVRRWWVVLVGLVLGALIGFAVSSSGSRPYQAQAIVYLGQPLYPGSSTPILPLTTSFRLVDQILHSTATMRVAAAKIGVPRQRLDRAVSLGAFSVEGPTKTGTPGRLVTITVKGFAPRAGVDAANALSASVIRQISTYTDTKLATYQKRLERITREMAFVNARIADATSQQAKVLNERTLPDAERLIVLANFNNVITFNEQRRANLEQSQLSLGDQVSLANQVEKARVLEPATASRVAAPSRRAGALAGGLIGAVIGVLVALLWDPVARRVRKRPAPAA
jgi:uncharacterized protein involved in exopolysaccharide biosynthesis